MDSIDYLKLMRFLDVLLVPFGLKPKGLLAHDNEEYEGPFYDNFP